MAGADRSPQKTRAAEPQIADLRDDASTVSSLESLPTRPAQRAASSTRRPTSSVYTTNGGGSMLICGTIFCACAVVDDGEDDAQRAYFKYKQSAKGVDLVAPPVDVGELHAEIERRGTPLTGEEIEVSAERLPSPHIPPPPGFARPPSPHRPPPRRGHQVRTPRPRAHHF